MVKLAVKYREQLEARIFKKRILFRDEQLVVLISALW